MLQAQARKGCRQPGQRHSCPTLQPAHGPVEGHRPRAAADDGVALHTGEIPTVEEQRLRQKFGKSADVAFAAGRCAPCSDRYTNYKG